MTNASVEKAHNLTPNIWLHYKMNDTDNDAIHFWWSVKPKSKDICKAAQNGAHCKLGQLVPSIPLFYSRNSNQLTFS